MSQERPWRFLLAALLLAVLLLAMAGPAGADAAKAPTTSAKTPIATNPATCVAGAGLAAYGALPQNEAVPTAPVTRLMPDDGHAEVLINAPKDDDFYVYDSASPETPLSVLAAVPAPADLNPAFTARDSEVQVQIAEQPLWWPSRMFTVIACDPKTATWSWGRFSARVGDATTSAWICILGAIATYFFLMLCLQDSRRPGGTWLFAPFARFRKQPTPPPQSALADRYPSFFKRQELGRLQIFNPIHLTVNEFGAPSVQKFQVVMFSAVVVGLLFYLVFLNGTLSSLSITVVELMGITGVAAIASNGVNQQKTRLSFDNWAWLQKNKVMKDTKYPHYARWSELLTTQKEFDVYKMQALVFSVAVAIALFIAGTGGDLASFKVPDELLGVLGLSQVTYVGGLLVQAPSIQELDAALTKLRAARANYDLCLASKRDVDDKGNVITPPPPWPPVAPAAQAPKAWQQLKDQIDTIIPMLESTLEVEVDEGVSVLKP